MTLALERTEWIRNAARIYNAFNEDQIVYLVNAGYEVKSEGAAEEIVRLMKLDVRTYGGLFKQNLPDGLGGVPKTIQEWCDERRRVPKQTEVDSQEHPED